MTRNQPADRRLIPRAHHEWRYCEARGSPDHEVPDTDERHGRLSDAYLAPSVSYPEYDAAKAAMVAMLPRWVK